MVTIWEPSNRSPVTILLSVLCFVASLLLENQDQVISRVIFGCFASALLVIGSALEQRLLESTTSLDALDFLPSVLTVMGAALDKSLPNDIGRAFRLIILVLSFGACLELVTESYFDGDVKFLRKFLWPQPGKLARNTSFDTKTKQRRFMQNRGTFIQKYEVRDKLGSGCFGTVVLCLDKSKRIDDDQSRCFAAKCILRLKLTPDQESQIRNEVKVLNEIKFQHSGIVHMVEFFDEPDSFYLVLELMRGGELFERIKNKEKYYERDARVVVRTIANALSFLHSRNIVHRDIKPENILLDSDGPKARVKLADFGFARKVDRGCRTACGTPMYVAPEVIDGSVYGTSVDIWSIGVITYILLSGVPPFHEPDRKKLFKKIKACDFDFPDRYFSLISFQAQDFIKKCLKRNPKDRLTADEVLMHPWITNEGSQSRLRHSVTSERLDFEKASPDGLPELLNAKSLIKLFNARMKLKAGILAAIAANKMNDIVKIVKETKGTTKTKARRRILQ